MDAYQFSHVSDLTEILPDYKGYSQPNEGLQSDKIFREYVYTRLMKCRRSCQNTVLKFIENKKIEDIKGMEDIGSRMLELAVSVKELNYDASSLFNNDNIRPEIMESLCSHDLNIIEFANEMYQSIRRFSKEVLSDELLDDGDYHSFFYYLDDLVDDFKLVMIMRDYLIVECN